MPYIDASAIATPYASLAFHIAPKRKLPFFSRAHTSLGYYSAAQTLWGQQKGSCTALDARKSCPTLWPNTCLTLWETLWGFCANIMSFF